MIADCRAAAAKFYDLSPRHPDDVPFYLERLPSPRAHVLELGCGTGRVSVPLAERCAFLLGIDLSEGMLRRCRGRLLAAGLGEDRARVAPGDICRLDLVLSIAMRCWYPDELLDRVRSEGFVVTGTWGGYHDEPYGEGGELVVEFAGPA